MITDELIARRPKGRSGLADWYRDVFQAQAAEGLSMADLATLLGMSIANLYHWRRRVPARQITAATSKRHGLVEVTAASKSESVDSPIQASPVFHVKIGQRCIEVPHGFDPSSLKQLIGALESC